MGERKDKACNQRTLQSEDSVGSQDRDLLLEAVPIGERGTGRRFDGIKSTFGEKPGANTTPFRPLEYLKAGAGLMVHGVQ